MNINCPQCNSLETDCNAVECWCFECEWHATESWKGFSDFRAAHLERRKQLAEFFDALLAKDRAERESGNV